MARAPGGRAVIVGAGHNGLVCAALLAQAGMRVTVLEQAQAPGGAVSSGADTLPGFVHDRCAGFFPATRLSPVFAELALERDGLEWVVPDVVMAHPFADGSVICLNRNLLATVESLERAVPSAGKEWARLVGLLTPNRELLIEAGLSPFPPLSAGVRLAARLRRDGIELAGRLLSSASAFGHQVLGGERAAAWLAGSASHADLPPDASGTAAIGLFLNVSGHWVGWPFPRGGAARLTELLCARVRLHGGEIRCGATVERVLRRGSGASGVALAGGEQLPADATVVTVSARPLASMLGEGALPARVMKRLRGWRYGQGTVKVDFALSGPVPWTSYEAREAGVVHLAGELGELFDAAHAAARGELPGAPALVVGQHSLFDSTRAPQGGHTLYCYARITPNPRVDDEALGALVEQRIDAFAPGFRDLILARKVRSPRRLELDNPSLVGGDLAGGSMALDQDLIFRPAPELIRYRTPLPGLYVAGASVHPGPAVHGASGASAARAVLADRSGWRGVLLEGRARARSRKARAASAGTS